jgi:hypothetical protein
LPNISLTTTPGRSGCRVDDADGVEHAGHAEGGELAGEHRLAEAGLHEALRGQVVDLVGAVLLQDGSARPRRAGRPDELIRSWMWAMRSKLTVLDRRTMPMTS